MRFSELVTVVLAGNDENPDILGGVGQSSKFFMPFGDELVGDRILRAIDATQYCKSIYVAAPLGLAQDYTFTSRHPLHIVLQGETRTESVMNVVREAQKQVKYVDGDYLLVVVGDLPLLCPEALERFIVTCQEAEEADFYIGMIPFEAVSPALRPAYERDLLPFCGGLYLHSDVYLFRPDSLTGVGRKRFEQIVRIRRSNRKSLCSVLSIAVAVLRIVGLRGLLPFVRTVVGPRSGNVGRQGQARVVLDDVERIALDLIEEKFGPKASLVTVHEPALVLDFDRGEQFNLLVEYASGHT